MKVGWYNLIDKSYFSILNSSWIRLIFSFSNFLQLEDFVYSLQLIHHLDSQDLLQMDLLVALKFVLAFSLAFEEVDEAGLVFSLALEGAILVKYHTVNLGFNIFFVEWCCRRSGSSIILVLSYREALNDVVTPILSSYSIDVPIDEKDVLI